MIRAGQFNIIFKLSYMLQAKLSVVLLFVLRVLKVSLLHVYLLTHGK